MILLINAVSSIAVSHSSRIQCNMPASLQHYNCSCLRKYSLSSPLNSTRGGSELCSEQRPLRAKLMLQRFFWLLLFFFSFEEERCNGLLCTCFVCFFVYMHVQREITPISENKDLKIYFTLTVLTCCPSR